MNCCTSFQETSSTGHRPQPEKREGFVPIICCHSVCVTSCLPSQKPRLIRTRVTGRSRSEAFGRVEPIRNSPAGTHTNSIPSNTRDSPARSCPDSVPGKSAAPADRAGSEPRSVHAGGDGVRRQESMRLVKLRLVKRPVKFGL